MQINAYLSPCTKLKIKLINNLNINPDTLRLLEEKVGNNLESIGTVDSFLDRTPKLRNYDKHLINRTLLNSSFSKVSERHCQ